MRSGSESNCLISSFYIKPQRIGNAIKFLDYCLISSFYIKPQLSCIFIVAIFNCLISSFYIKPQRVHPRCTRLQLSYIVFLHQTTTSREFRCSCHLLSYIVFLHQTTTIMCGYSRNRYCLISSFYIKPQPHLYIYLILNQFYRI